MNNQNLAQSIGKTIRLLRVSRNLTGVDLAIMAGCGSSRVCHYESGQECPTIKTLVKILDALEISYSDFFLKVEQLERRTARP